MFSDGKKKAGILFAVLIISLAFGALLVDHFILGMADTQEFELTKWENGDLRERGKMARSLVKSDFLLEKSKPEIIAILGEPTNGNSSSVGYLVHVGMYFAFRPWHYVLWISFDESTGKSENVFLVD